MDCDVAGVTGSNCQSSRLFSHHWRQLGLLVGEAVKHSVFV